MKTIQLHFLGIWEFFFKLHIFKPHLKKMQFQKAIFTKKLNHLEVNFFDDTSQMPVYCPSLVRKDATWCPYLVEFCCNSLYDVHD